MNTNKRTVALLFVLLAVAAVAAYPALTAPPDATWHCFVGDRTWCVLAMPAEHPDIDAMTLALGHGLDIDTAHQSRDEAWCQRSVRGLSSCWPNADACEHFTPGPCERWAADAMLERQQNIVPDWRPLDALR